MLGWFVLPFGTTFANYRINGVRYVYSVFPPFAILTGAGLVIIGTALTRWRPGTGPRKWLSETLPTTALVAMVTVYLVVIDHRIHPFYLDYFNEAVGGAANVRRTRLLETGWWGEGIDEGVEWVNAHAPAGATYSIDAWCPPGVIKARRDLVRNDDMAQFVVSQRMSYPAARYREVYEIRAGGATIVKVLRLIAERPLHAAKGPG
jgi:hypothetical protein